MGSARGCAASTVEGRRTHGRLAATLLGLIVILGVAGGCQAGDHAEPADSSSAAEGGATVAEPEAITFAETVDDSEYVVATASLSAVGDNLMNMPVVYSADRAEGEMNDGLYDFGSLYAGVRDIVDTHDINFIDIETIIGGDELGISGYPIFNTPTDNATDIANFGFNLATTATNHSLDKGFEGIQGSAATWATHPEVVVTGTFVNEEDRNRIRTFETQGITFAFLAYTDSLNGIPMPDGRPWAVATDDREAISRDLEAANTLADVVIVAMSWGDENVHEPNDRQRETAQLLANGGADLVLGFGPHVIQPVEWVEGLDGIRDADRPPDARGLFARQLHQQSAEHVRQRRRLLHLRYPGGR